MSSSPSFVSTPKEWSGSVGSGGTTGAWYFLRDNTMSGAGASGSKITSLTATSTDSTARAIQVAVLRGISQTGAAGVSSANVAITFNAGSATTFTIASPGQGGGQLAHNLIAGDQVVWTGTFNAAANIVQGNTMFVVAGGLSATVFELAFTAGGTAVVNGASATATAGIMYTAKILGAVTVGTSSGTDGGNTGTNILSNSLLPGIPVDNDGNPYIFLEATDYLAFSPVALPAANKVISLTAFGGNF